MKNASQSARDGSGRGAAWHAALLAAAVMLVFAASLLPAAAAVAGRAEDLLKGFIRDTYPWAETELSDLVLNGELPKGEPERIFVQKGMPGRTVFDLRYKDGSSVVVSAYVRAFDWAVMSRRALRKGAVLQKEDVYSVLVESSRIPGDAVRQGDAPAGSVMSRSVMANVPITTGMLQESQQIRRGQRVMIVAESGGLSIHAKGELKETGHVGNDVKVMNLDSRKVVVGRLINENTVKVVF